MDNIHKINMDNDNDESEKIVSNFKNELEKIKQKLGKNYIQQSQPEKEKNNTNFHYINNKKIEPKERKIIEFESEYTNINNNINENEKDREKSTNQNTSIFSKIPSFEELKMKYDINNNKPNGIKDIKIETNINKFKNNKDIQLLTDNNKNIKNDDFTEMNNKNAFTQENEKYESDIKEKKDINYNNFNNNKFENIEIKNDNNIDKDLEKFNFNEKLENKNSNVNNNKFDLINLLNLQKDAENEIKNIFNKRELLELSDDSDDEKFKSEKKEEEEEEIDIINKYIKDNKIGNNDINLNIPNNNINNNNICDFSNISNINNNKEENMQNQKEEIQQIDKKEFKESNNDKNDTNNLTEDQSPIKPGNNNNNNSIMDTSMLNSKLVQQIKLIDETSENNRKTEEKNQIKLKEIENTLQLDERLTHKNREIRKNAIKELCEMCTNFNNDEDNREKAFECFSPWVKYCLEETNSYVIPESLNFFILFNTLFPHFLSVSIKDFFDNIERYINFGLQTINEKCYQILYTLFQDKKVFAQSLNYIRILFEKIINIYSKTNSKTGKKRKIYSDLLIYIFNNIEDDYSTIRNNLKISSLKEIDMLFNKLKKNKENKFKFRLYNEVNLETSIINKNNKSNSKMNKSPDKKIENNEKKDKNNIKDKKEKNNINDLIINTNPNPDVTDILSIIPNEFFEYHFLTQFQAKIKLLESTNNILSKIKNIKDKEKNLVDVYRTINYSIEDSNILIHLEGIKLLENICRLVQNYNIVQILKLLLEKCFDKLKDKKSLVKSELFSLFNMVIENKCLEADKFILFILHFCTNQKKENSQVKMGLLEYIKYLFLQQNNILFYEVNKIKEKELFNFVKKIVIIIQKESLSSVKDLCSDLLIIIKRRVEDEEIFYELISELPNYRKKIIRDEGIEEREEGEYKKNLRRIKSSYSFSKTKYNSGFRKNNFNINSSSKKEKVRSNNFERNNSTEKENMSYSQGKNMKIKNNLNKKDINKERSKSKNNTRTNFRLNIKSQTGGLTKFNPKNIKENKKISNNNKNNNNINKKNNNRKNDIEEKNIENINTQKETEFYKNKPNKRKVKEELNNNNVERKKENLLDNIHNLNIIDVEKYSKVMISDFLIFIKKVCNGEKQDEDLSYHFNLIFIIFEKFLYRIIVLLNENKEKKDKYLKLKKLLDEFIRNICKVIIITPCIEQIKGSNKFDITLLETFMEKIKDFCLNKEKFYMNLLLSLYKFCERDEAFPPELNPKPAVFYFLRYLQNGYLETKSENLLNVLKEFISETKLLNNEEKNKLLINNNEEIQKEYNENNSEDNNEINNDENMNEERKESKENEKEENELEQKEEIDNSIENGNISDNNDSDEEEKKKTEIYNNKIKDEILNNNKIENESEINKINTNNIMTKLRQFQEKLNKIPSIEKEKESKDITKAGTDEKNSKINENELKINNKKEEESEDSNSDEDFNIKDKNINNKSNMLKLNDNDFQKIEDSIKIMSKRLDNTLNKMNQLSANKNNNSRRSNLIINNINTNSINNLNSINNSFNVSKISENNNNASIITSESLIKNNLFNLNSNTNKNKEIIEQMIKVVKGELNQINIFQKIKEYFKMINSVEEKIDFIKILKNNLENPTYLNIIPINSCTNLFDFILSILSFQILTQSNNEQIIVELQGMSENLMNFRQLNDMFKIMLFLLKKYFPKNLNNKIEDIALVMIKVISYLLKELLKKINQNNIIGKDIISEINDLFTVTPPSTLTTATPNAMFYKHIFTLLKSITDQIISFNKDELVNIIQYLQENKIVCEDYIQYLIRLQKKFN